MYIKIKLLKIHVVYSKAIISVCDFNDVTCLIHEIQHWFVIKTINAH